MTMTAENIDRPSIFVLLAEDQLQASLRGAVRFVIKFLMGKYPQQLAPLKPHSAELQLLLELAIQWSYLHRWNGTFTERFFSLQRFSLVPNSGSSQQNSPQQISALSRKDILLSLVAASLVPYLLAKLDRRLEVAKDRAQTNERFGQALYELTAGERFLISGHYATAKQISQLLKVLLWISYSVGGGGGSHHLQTASHSSSLPLALLRLLTGRHLQLGASNEAFLQLQENSSWSSLLSFKLTTFFDVALKSGAFLVQFLEYWYAQADVRQMLTTVSGPLIPPPPSRPPKNLSIAPDLCPLCLQTRSNETALATSGYVFCYLCIHNYVKANRQCPVTGFPCTLDQLIRVFD